MRSAFLLLLAAALAGQWRTGGGKAPQAASQASPAAPVNQLTPAERAAGWELLFDGRTMNGWRDPAGRRPPGHAWVVEDGCLKAVPHCRIREDLFTRRSFQDFELAFDWRIAPGGNSGVKYRIQGRAILVAGQHHPGAERFEDTVNYELLHPSCTRATIPAGARGDEYVVAFEYQLIDDQRHPDARHGRDRTTGAIYSLVAPSRAMARPVGEFNHSRIVLRGHHVEHWLNGVKVVDAELDSAPIARGLAARWGKGSRVYELLTRPPRQKTPIALQNHNSTVWFRNLKIREF